MILVTKKRMCWFSNRIIYGIQTQFFSKGNRIEGNNYLSGEAVAFPISKNDIEQLDAI